MILPHMLQTMTDEKAKKNRHTAIKALPTVLELTDEIAYCTRLVEFSPLHSSMPRQESAQQRTPEGGDGNSGQNHPLRDTSPDFSGRRMMPDGISFAAAGFGLPVEL